MAKTIIQWLKHINHPVFRKLAIKYHIKFPNWDDPLITRNQALKVKYESFGIAIAYAFDWEDTPFDELWRALYQHSYEHDGDLTTFDYERYEG